MGNRTQGWQAKMKIVFVEQESRMGGVEYTTLRVAKALDPLDFQPVIVCPNDGDLPRLARKYGIKVDIVSRPELPSVSVLWKNYYFPNPIGIALVALNVTRSSRILRKYFETNKADLIITKGLLSHFYGGLAAKWNKIPCIWYMQEEVDKKRAFGLFRNLLIYFADRLPDRIIVDARALIDQFSGSKISNNIRVIHNGIETEHFSPISDEENESDRKALNIPQGAFVIGQAGRIIPLKGQELLLKAFIDLKSEFPSLHLLFVGSTLFGKDDYLNKLKNIVQENNLVESVHFTGFLPDVKQGLGAMDVFAHCSLETDSPVSVLEAMSCGLPIVVSDVAGTEEMFEDGIEGFRFVPGNTGDLTTKLKKLLLSRALRLEIGKNARRAIIQNFTDEASVLKLLSVIKEVNDN